MQDTIEKQLYALQDTTYQTFQKRIIPNDDTIIGVRMPALRKLAKQILKEDPFSYLQEAKDTSFESIMLQGLVISNLKMDWQSQLPYITSFIPKIYNWAICDIFVGNLKMIHEHPKEMYAYLLPYLQSDKEYEIRFGVVCILNYYVNKEYREQVFSLFSTINHEGYYVKMAIAWALSYFYISFPQETIAYLNKNTLDFFTHNKTISKICESNQVSKEEKQAIKQIKRSM